MISSLSRDCVTFNILGAMRKFICFMLTLLGFGAVVSCEEDEVVPAPEYGVPYVVYRVSARVVDGEGTSIKGIALMHSGWNTATIGLSNDDGVVTATTSDYDLPIELCFVDVDGEDNGGEFETLNLDVTDEFELIEEGEGWKQGTYEANLGDVTLTQK